MYVLIVADLFLLLKTRRKQASGLVQKSQSWCEAVALEQHFPKGEPRVRFLAEMRRKRSVEKTRFVDNGRYRPSWRPPFGVQKSFTWMQ